MPCSSCSDRAPYCAACREQRVKWSLGTAFARGVRWARRHRGERRTWPRWPDASEGWRTRARVLVADLTGGDVELGELLAAECLEAAAAEWWTPAPRVGPVSFTLR